MRFMVERISDHPPTLSCGPSTPWSGRCRTEIERVGYRGTFSFMPGWSFEAEGRTSRFASRMGFHWLDLP